jgi:HD-like signal output (HDOD) protein
MVADFSDVQAKTVDTTALETPVERGELRGRVRRTLARLAPTAALPELSPQTRALLALVRERPANATAIARLVQSDVALAARILRAATVWSDIPEAGASVRQAIDAIGPVRAAEVAIAIGVGRLYAGIPGADAHWRHALAVAVAAAQVVPTGAGDDGPAPFVPALLHDVGRIALACADPMTTAAIERVSAQQAGGRDAVERDWYGFDHGAASAALGEDLGLSAEECDAVGAHHRPAAAAGAARALAVAINAADALAYAIGCGVGTRQPADVAAGSAGLHADAEARAASRLRDELARWQTVLG